MNYEFETFIADTILLYIFFRYLMKIIQQDDTTDKVIENINLQVESIVDEHNINYYKNLYLKQSVEYLLMVVEEERQELLGKTEELYKLVLDYEEFEKKEKEYVQINQDKDQEVQSLKDKNKRLVQIMFKFLVTFDSEIEDYKNREVEYKNMEEKYMNQREEFNFLSLE